MAEPAGFDPRRLLLVGGVIAVVLFSGLFFFFRSCAPAVGKKPGYTIVYSNLELKDAANTIARLKELAIPYEIRDDGRAVAVPKEKADQARLGLAEKNLPAGGVVGWEIFDESRLGATDFDRRVQLIRAISGELSRTIRRIEGVADVRVQIVIPETKLFAATVAPVTASIMLHLRPGVEIQPGKINGIVHLVASSVENLQPENVTVIDEAGRILSAKTARLETVSAPAAPVEVAFKEEIVTKETTVKTVEAVAVTPQPTVVATPEKTALTVEEKILMKVQAKKELEQDLSGRTQELLNRFFPPNSVIVKVSVDVKPAREPEIKAKDLKIKKLNAVVLLDNRLDLTAKLKQITFSTVAAAVNYNKKRGDKIILQKVPFHLAVPPPPPPPKPSPVSLASFFPLKYLLWPLSALLALLIAFWLIGRLRRVPVAQTVTAPSPARPAPEVRERFSMLDQVKMAAERNPEKIAELLKGWLSK